MRTLQLILLAVTRCLINLDNIKNQFPYDLLECNPIINANFKYLQDDLRNIQKYIQLNLTNADLIAEFETEEELKNGNDR